MSQKVILRSYLDNQPVIVEHESGTLRAFGVMKTFESFRSPEGDFGRTKPETHYIGAWGSHEAEMLARHKKGAYIEVEGVLERTKYKGKDGIYHDSYIVRPDSIKEVSPSLSRLNSFTVEGRLTDDPTVFNKTPGKGRASMGLAVDVRDYDLKHPTLYQPVETFNRNRVDEIAGLKKGDLVKIEGKLATNVIHAPNGETQERYVLSPKTIELISKNQNVETQVERRPVAGNEITSAKTTPSKPSDNQVPEYAF